MIDVQFEKGIYSISLNRPQMRNALNISMRRDLIIALKNCPEDARVIALFGTKSAFCAGQDLSEFDEKTDVKKILSEEYEPILEEIKNANVPVFAFVEGAVAGAGVSLTLAADMVFASQTSYFQVAFGRVGLIPDIGLTHILPRLIGQARAIGLALTGERLSAQKALEWGMIWDVWPDEDFDQLAENFLTEISQGPTAAYEKTKNLMRQSWNTNLTEQLELEADAQALSHSSFDHKEGVSAFLEKRLPKFKGH